MKKNWTNKKLEVIMLLRISWTWNRLNKFELANLAMGWNILKSTAEVIWHLLLEPKAGTKKTHSDMKTNRLSKNTASVNVLGSEKRLRDWNSFVVVPVFVFFVFFKTGFNLVFMVNYSLPIQLMTTIFIIIIVIVQQFRYLAPINFKCFSLQ